MQTQHDERVMAVDVLPYVIYLTVRDLLDPAIMVAVRRAVEAMEERLPLLDSARCMSQESLYPESTDYTPRRLPIIPGDKRVRPTSLANREPAVQVGLALEVAFRSS
jgi:hypothetical protein